MDFFNGLGFSTQFYPHFGLTPFQLFFPSIFYWKYSRRGLAVKLSWLVNLFSIFLEKILLKIFLWFLFLVTPFRHFFLKLCFLIGDPFFTVLFFVVPLRNHIDDRFVIP